MVGGYVDPSGVLWGHLEGHLWGHPKSSPRQMDTHVGMQTMPKRFKYGVERLFTVSDAFGGHWGSIWPIDANIV